MHVLAIHMKVMAPRQQLSDLWSMVTAIWSSGPGKAIVNTVKTNRIPILLQDPVTLMIHFILLLPVNVDVGKLTRFIAAKKFYFTKFLAFSLQFFSFEFTQ